MFLRGLWNVFLNWGLIELLINISLLGMEVGCKGFFRTDITMAYGFYHWSIQTFFKIRKNFQKALIECLYIRDIDGIVLFSFWNHLDFFFYSNCDALHWNIGIIIAIFKNKFNQWRGFFLWLNNACCSRWCKKYKVHYNMIIQLCELTRYRSCSLIDELGKCFMANWLDHCNGQSIFIRVFKQL